MKTLDGRPRVLKVVKTCVFCNRSIKKGQSAVSKIKDVFEHPKCSEDSSGYLGEDNFLERFNGIPRCHLCGWYQLRLDLHIELHDMTEEEYRNTFGIDEDERLIAFTEYGDIAEAPPVPKRNVPGKEIRQPMLTRPSREIKRDNPRNRKRKSQRKKR